MQRASFYVVVCILAGGLAAGCASTSKMAAPSPAGEWDYTVFNTPQGDVTGTLMIVAEGDVYSGEIVFEAFNQTASMTDVAFTDSTFSFKAIIDAGGQLVDLDTRMTLNGNMMKGKMDASGFGGFDISATRKEKAGGEM